MVSLLTILLPSMAPVKEPSSKPLRGEDQYRKASLRADHRNQERLKNAKHQIPIKQPDLYAHAGKYQRSLVDLLPGSPRRITPLLTASARKRDTVAALPASIPKRFRKLVLVMR